MDISKAESINTIQCLNEVIYRIIIIDWSLPCGRLQ